MVRALWLMLIAVLANVNLAMADVSARLDRSHVELGESISLIVDISDAAGGQTDLSPLDESFDVAGRQKRSSMQIINGDMQRSTQLVIGLVAKREGELRVPPLLIEGETTEAMTIRVYKPNLSENEQNAVAIDGGIDRETLWLQQPTIYTLQVTVRSKLLGASLTPPTADDSELLIEPLGEQEKSDTVIDGVPAQLVVQRYLMTPQRSGRIEVQPARLQVKIAKGKPVNTVLGPRYNQYRNMTVETDPLVLDVKPVPAQMSSSQWLVADSVKLTDNWSALEVMQGDAITRTLRLEVSGIRANQLPELELQVPAGVRQYPEEAVTDESFSAGRLQATLEREIVLIPAQSGALKFPAVELKWWNPTTAQIEVATLSAREIKVQPAAGQIASPSPAVVTAPVKAVETPVVKTEVEQVSPVVNKTEAGKEALLYKLIIVLLLIVVALLSYLLWRKPARSAAVPVKASEPERSAKSLTELEKNLRKLCEQDEASGVRQALSHWCSQRWPGHHNPMGVLIAEASPELKAEIERLNRHLYSDAGVQWNAGKRFWQAFSTLSGQLQSSQQTAGALGKLNPM